MDGKVNDVVVHLSNENLPFGGVGESGMGSYHGKRSFEAFSHQKAVLYRSNLGENFTGLRYPPYTSTKQFLLRIITKPWLSAWLEWLWSKAQMPSKLNLLLILLLFLARRR